LGGGAEPGELPHGPKLAAIHRLVDAARVRELARVAQVARVVQAGDALGRVERLDGPAGDRGERDAALLRPRRRLLHRLQDLLHSLRHGMSDSTGMAAGASKTRPP